MRPAGLLAVLTLFSTAAGAGAPYGAKVKFQQGTRSIVTLCTTTQ